MIAHFSPINFDNYFGHIFIDCGRISSAIPILGKLKSVRTPFQQCRAQFDIKTPIGAGLSVISVDQQRRIPPGGDAKAPRTFWQLLHMISMVIFSGSKRFQYRDILNTEPK